MKTELTEDKLRRRVDKVIALGDEDPEDAHSREDKLLTDLVFAFCPDWVQREVDRMLAADFPRWRA